MSGKSGDRRSDPQNAFLAWFNKLPIFTPQHSPITFKDLSDGQKLWKALQNLNPTEFAGDLPETANQSGKWVNNLQNLKKIYRALQKYTLETLDKPLPADGKDIDIKAIAEGSNHEETTKLLKLVFAVTTASEGNEAYIGPVIELPQAEQEVLMAAVLEFQASQQVEEQEEEIQEYKPQPSPTKVPVDADLYNEELYGKLAAENTRLEQEKKDLQRDMRDLSSRLTRLQEHNGVLLEDLRAAQDAAKQATTNINDSIRIKELETKLRGQEDHIANQEEQLGEYDTRYAALETELNKLRNIQEKLQPLQDTVDELRVERDNLARRNNALERYKLKVQDAQDVENENKSLRRELEESKQISQEGDGVRQHNIALQREVSELKSLMANTEIQLVEAQQRRRQIELENHHYREKLEEAIQQRERDQEIISNLTGGLPQLALDAGNQPLDLEQELESSGKHEEEIQRDLKSKSDQLTKLSSDAAARSTALQQLLDEEKAKRVDLQERYMESYRRNLALENIVKDPASHESQKLYAELQANFEAEKKKSKALEEGKRTVEEQLEDAQNTISVIQANESGSLEKLYSSKIQDKDAKIITLESRVKDLEMQLDEHRTMLSMALGESISSAGNLKDSSAELARSSELSQSREEAMAARKKLEKDIEEKEREAEELRKALQKATEKATPALLKAAEQAALKQQNENLRREVKLMTTAFYDLNSRLQMNNVSLQRRSNDAPKSFLNRGRLQVSKATAIQTR